MKRNSRNVALLISSIGGFTLMGISFLLMPVESLAVLSGLLFWVGLLTGTVCQILLEQSRRRFLRHYRMNPKKMPPGRIGIFTFFANRYGVVTDALLGVSLLAVLVVMMITRGMGGAGIICIGIAVWLFSMHCILNGRCYYFVMNQEKIRRMPEQKKNEQAKERSKHET